VQRGVFVDRLERLLGFSLAERILCCEDVYAVWEISEYVFVGRLVSMLWGRGIGMTCVVGVYGCVRRRRCAG